MKLDVTTDLDALTLTVDASFDHPIEAVWQLYADPRKIERWWGPPTYPATFVEHTLTPGSVTHYYMTSPEGEQFHGRWDVQGVDEHEGFTIVDGFAHADGSLNEDMPTTTAVFTFTAEPGRTRLHSVSTYTSREALEQVLEMGMIEGLTGAMGQMEGVLAG